MDVVCFIWMMKIQFNFNLFALLINIHHEIMLITFQNITLVISLTADIHHYQFQILLLYYHSDHLYIKGEHKMKYSTCSLSLQCMLTRNWWLNHLIFVLLLLYLGLTTHNIGISSFILSTLLRANPANHYFLLENKPKLMVTI